MSGLSQQEGMAQIAQFFRKEFPETLTPNQIEAFVLSLFNLSSAGANSVVTASAGNGSILSSMSVQHQQEVSVLVQDFLKVVKVFGGPDEAYRKAKEDALQLQKEQDEARKRQIPGMLYAHQQQMRGGSASGIKGGIDDDDDDDL